MRGGRATWHQVAPAKPIWNGDKADRNINRERYHSVRACESASSVACRRPAPRLENWRGNRHWILRDSADHDLCLAIAAAEIMGDRYRLSHRWMRDHGTDLVGLAVSD